MTPDPRKYEILGLVLNVLHVPQVEIKLALFIFHAHIFWAAAKLLFILHIIYGMYF
jgi:hypothetical protein